MIDPIKLKKIIVIVLKVIIVIELISAFGEGIHGNWTRFAGDLIGAGFLYLTWDRLKYAIAQRKQISRQKIERSTEHIRLWDALAFSLLWSDEIYTDIPQDRKRLVVISYTLIALGVCAAFFHIGPGLMMVVIVGGLVLGAVNLLAWVVSLERGEKESLQTELALAHDVQISLMPKEQPSVPGYDIAGMSLPAQEVGGDHFDYAFLGGGKERFGISIVDVSGKGMQAAMSAVFTSGAYSSEVKQSSSPAEILTRLNRSIYSHTKRGQFVSFLLAVLSFSDRTLCFANAGQTKPILYSSHSTEHLNSLGVTFPLGMKEDSTYEERSIRLQTGDVVLLLTDGITEAMNTQKELFGLERLELCLANADLPAMSARQIMNAIIECVRRFSEGSAQHDDMTLVVIKVL